MGWSKEFGANLGVLVAQAGGAIGANGSSQSHAEILFRAELGGAKGRALPDSLAWYSHEPTWQRVADARLHYDLKAFSLSLRYEDDYGVNAHLQAKAASAGLDLGGKFEDHQTTVWRISGVFAETHC